MRNLEYIGNGRNRAVFKISPRSVIKVPVNEQGFTDNFREAVGSRKKNIWLARCKLLKDGCLLMELIDTSVDFKLLPDWADFFDCHQVGLDHKGRFKAYDYGG